MKNSRIVLKGQNYATPHTESVEIVNQGVLCASGKLTFSTGGLNNFSAHAGTL